MQQVVGNPQAQAILERALASGQLRHAYLLHGPAGVGKFTLAMAFAQAAPLPKVTVTGDEAAPNP